MTLYRMLLWLLPFLVKRQGLNAAKRRGLLVFLRALEGIRLSLVGVVTFSVVLNCLSMGLVLMLVSGLWLIQMDQQTRLLALFALGGGLFLLPAIALAIALSGRTWLRASGQQKQVHDLLRDDQ